MFKKELFKEYLPEYPFRFGPGKPKLLTDKFRFDKRFRDEAALLSMLESLGPIRQPLTAAEIEKIKGRFKTLVVAKIKEKYQALFPNSDPEKVTWDELLEHAKLEDKIKPDETTAVWSRPMPKSRMMTALGIDSYECFNAIAIRYGIDPINRSTCRIRLDLMDAKTRSKLEKA